MYCVWVLYLLEQDYYYYPFIGEESVAQRG